MANEEPVLIDTSLLRNNRSYRHFISSRVLSSLAFNGATVAIGWLVYDQTNSALALGLVGLIQFLPVLLLTFVVGHVADRYDRRRIGLICQVVEAVTVGIMAIGLWQGWLDTTGVFIGVAVMGCAIAFERPTMAALLPGIVPPAALQHAIATSTSFMQASIIIGPALGGLLYGLGPVAPFAAAALFFAGAGLNVMRIQRPDPRTSREPLTLKSAFAGVAFIRGRPVILGTLSLDLFAVLLGSITSLLPIFARDILEAGPWALGFLRAAPAVGALMMSIWLAALPAGAQCRHDHADSGRRLRRGNDRLCALDQYRAVRADAGGARRVRYGQHRHPQFAGAVADARRHARTRQCGQLAVHRRVEPVGRFRVGNDGRAARAGGGGPRRRHRHTGDRGDLGLAVPGAAQGADPVGLMP